MKNNQVLKLLLTAFLSFFIIYGTSQAGPQIVPGFSEDNDTFADQTSIGSVNVSGLTKDEAVVLLMDETSSWKEVSTLAVLEGQQESLVDMNFVNFMLEESVGSATNEQDNPLLVTVNMSNLMMDIQRDFGLPDTNWIDPAKLQFEIEKRVQHLSTEELTPLPFSALLAEGSGESILAESVGTFSASNNQQLFAGEHASTVVESGEFFSILNLAAQYGDTFLTDSELSQIATVIHGSAILTPMSIAERHISSSLPEWAEMGREARVEQAVNHDYRLLNASQAALTIDLEIVQQTLYVRIKGQEQPVTYEVENKDVQTISAKTIQQYSPFIAQNQTRIEEEGQEGYLATVEQIVFDLNRVEVERNKLYEDFYPPVHRVEIKPLDAPQPLPEQTNPIIDPVTGLPVNDPANPSSSPNDDDSNPGVDGDGNPTNPNSPSNEGVSGGNENSDSTNNNSNGSSGGVTSPTNGAPIGPSENSSTDLENRDELISGQNPTDDDTK